eukprot:5503593-Pyramimonas_sp.AAC.2
MSFQCAGVGHGCPCRWKKGDNDHQSERVFKGTKKAEPKTAQAKSSGFGGGFGGGGGKAAGKDKGKKSTKGKSGAKSGAAKRLDDSELIRQSEKEYLDLVDVQNKLGTGFLDYVVSVRAKGKAESAGVLSDWLPVAELMVLVDDEDSDGMTVSDLGSTCQHPSTINPDAKQTPAKSTTNKRAGIG